MSSEAHLVWKTHRHRQRLMQRMQRLPLDSAIFSCPYIPMVVSKRADVIIHFTTRYGDVKAG